MPGAHKSTYHTQLAATEQELDIVDYAAVRCTYNLGLHINLNKCHVQILGAAISLGEGSSLAP